MKKKILFILILFSLKGHSQSIDNIVRGIADSTSNSQINNFSKTLDYSKIVDATKSVSFNIDTIQLNNGEFKWFFITLTGIYQSTSGNTTTVSKGQALSYIAVSNIASIYGLYVSNPVPFKGITGVTWQPQLINNNTMCIIRVFPNNQLIKFHYRRTEN